MNKVVIRCQCGHRILRRDILQVRFYLSLFGPSFVSVHYRCGRCKRIGKQLVEEQRWAGFGGESGEEKNSRAEDLRRFQTMGAITPEEIVDFHRALENFETVSEETL
jgi:DNA-directed RNA polymerase subunit RPC12/RpoP